MLKPEELTAMRQRYEATMKGPWETDGTGGAIGMFRKMLCFGEKMCGSDIEFIAHARTDVPKLVAEVERLQAALAPLETKGVDL